MSGETTHRLELKTLQVTVHASDEWPQDTSPPLAIRWQGKPNAAELRVYAKWICGIYQDYATRWNRRLLILIPTPKGRPATKVFVPVRK